VLSIFITHEQLHVSRHLKLFFSLRLEQLWAATEPVSDPAVLVFLSKDLVVLDHQQVMQ